MHKVNCGTKLCFGIIVLCSLNIVIGILLSSNIARAESRTVNAAVTVPEACTMTSTNTAPHTATLSPNTYSGASGSEYENGIGKTTLSVICNDSNGFAIYAIGYTDNKYEGDNHTKLIGQNTSSTIDTAVYTNSTTPSNWSMKVNKVTDSTVSYNPQNMSILNSFDSWHIVPATYTKVAQYHANTGSSVTDDTLGAKVETTYAAFIAPNQPSDTYIGQVKYTMVHPYTEQPLQPQMATAGCINYFPNGRNVVGTMGCQSATDGNNIDLLASNYSRTGYGFAGWSNKFNYATNTDADLKFYGPNETITVPTGTTANGLSLYAVWIESEGSIQDTTKVAQLCSTGTGSLTAAPTDGTANLSSVSALTDQRDNNTYAIAKLADGKCWMIENLRLDNTAELTIMNTNNPLNDSDAINPTVTLKHNYTDSNTYNTLSASSNVAYDADTAPDGWCTTHSAACYDQSRLRTDDTANRATNNPNTNSSAMYSYGNYYNWYSATAGRGTYNKSSGTTDGDLCPTGWHLPSGTGSGEFGLLSNSLGGYKNASNVAQNMNSSTTPTGLIMSKRIRQFPNNSLYSGYVGGGSLRNRGSYGFYLSSTAYTKLLVYNLYLSSSYVYPGTNDTVSKYDGWTLRCVASN